MVFLNFLGLKRIEFVLNDSQREPGPRLLGRALLIVQVVAEHDRNGIGLTQLSRATDISKATCYRILSVLREWQWIHFDNETKRYRLGLGLFPIVGRSTRPGEVHDAVAGILRRLSAETEETAGLDIFIENEITVLEEIQGPSLISQSPRPVPRRMPAYCTSTGKVFLAWLSAEYVLQEYAAVYKRHGPAAAETLEEFVASLSEVRSRGYAVARDELEAGAAAVAAPVIAADRSVTCAIWIGGPSFRLTEARVAELGPQLLFAASEVASVLDATRSGDASFTPWPRQTPETHLAAQVSAADLSASEG